MRQIAIPIFQLDRIAVTVQCTKTVDLTIPAKKKKENEYNRIEFLGQKVDNTGLQAGLKLAFQINYTQPNFLRNVNVQIATVMWYVSYGIIKKTNFVPPA